MARIYGAAGAAGAAGVAGLALNAANGIGAQAQQPLARVVVGGMLTTVIAILFMMPLLIHLFRTKHDV